MNYAFIIRFILYHFVDFHAFDTHLFHRQDYHRIKWRLMIAVVIVVGFEKYDNFHCLPCKKRVKLNRLDKLWKLKEKWLKQLCYKPEKKYHNFCWFTNPLHQMYSILCNKSCSYVLVLIEDVLIDPNSHQLIL